MSNRAEIIAAAIAAGVMDDPTDLTGVRGGENQVGVIYDLISEGPIEGLNDTFSSVYFNGTPIIDPNSEAYKKVKTRKGYGTTTADSATVNTSSNFNLTEIDLSDGIRTVYIIGAGTTLTGNGSSTGATAVKRKGLISTSSSFFASTDANQKGGGLGTVYIRIEGAGPDGTNYFGRVVAYKSATEAILSPPPETSVEHATIVKDHSSTIKSITDDDTLVMMDAAATAVTNYKMIVGPPKFNAGTKLTDDGFNFEHVSTFFRTGHQHQDPPQRFAGQIGTTYAKAFGEDIKQTTNSTLGITGGQAQDIVIKTALADMDIVDPGEIDEVRVVFEFPSLIRVSKNTANEYGARVEFQIWFEYYQGGTWKNTAVPIYGVTDEAIKSRDYSGSDTLAQKVNYGLGDAGKFNNGVVYAKTKNKYLWEFPIDIEKFKPFSNFRIRIKRVTGNELLEHTKYQNQHQSRLNAVYCNVHDRQNYAHSAYAGVTFKSSEFSAVPQRAYEIKGMKIQVPTNYVTRDEATDGVAAYTRNISSGATAGTYQTWDGNFRGDIANSIWRSNPQHVNYQKVYSNNPAWCYYDIMVNNRYGLGDFLKAENIDKYQLYAIARYCDELVPDGEGGQEPRFTCNLYLKERQDAYKVLSDMASIFRSMLHWMNSQAIVVQERPKEPIYTFTKSNIVDGIFQYQSSSLRMRTNQCNVTWNDPKRFYKQYVEAVDDVDNIIDTGRVIPKSIVAMGCTSQGQANRLARWTLLTEKLEHELVSFKTGINAAFLKPGDLVYIQDSNDSGVSASGRVSNTGTRSATVIPLDRTITLDSGDTYYLHLIYPKGGAYLNEDGPQYLVDASSTAFNRGDLITTAKIPSNTNTAVAIDTEEKAAQVLNWAGTGLQTYWTPYSRIETQTVTTSAGNVSSLTTAAFAGGTPDAEVMWALTNATASNTAKSARPFRIVSIKEDEKANFDITGQFYDETKYDSIERGYEVYQRDYEALPQKDHRVPFVGNVSVKFEPMTSGGTGSGEEQSVNLYNAILTWAAPTNVADNDTYTYLKGYDVLHNATSTGGNSPVINLTPDTTSYTIGPIVTGEYRFAVRVVSTLNQVGQWVEIGEKFRDTEKSVSQTVIPSTTGLKHGGALTTTISLESTDQVTLGSADYNITSPTGKVTTITSGTTAYDFGTAGLQSGETGYFLWDDSATDWKMVEEYSDTTVLNAAGSSFGGGVNYWKEIATGSAGLTRVTAGNDALATVAITETVNSESLTKYGNTISVGTIKTKLDDEFSQGDFIKLGTGTAAWYGTVKSVSDPNYFNPNIAVNTTNNSIKIPGNTFTTNQALYYQRDGNTLIGGLTDNTLYYVVDIDHGNDLFKLSASSGGSAISLTGTGSDANQYLQSATGTITTTEPIFKAFDGGGTDAYIYKLAFVPDRENDFLYAKIINTSGSYAITVLGTQPGAQGPAGGTGGSGLRGGSIFTFEENTNGNITDANVTNWTGTLNESNAEDVAGAVIAAASDNYIRTNDRITLTDNSANKAGTRVFTGTSTATEGDVDHNDFSSLVVEQFDGSVIVDGTLVASKINTGSITLATFSNSATGYTDDTVANTKTTVFRQTSAPTALKIGDVWIDTDDGNKLYQATATGTGSWVASQDGTIATAQNTADSKTTVFRQTSAPTALKIGDLWIDTDDGNKLYQATATGTGSWVASQDGTIATAQTAAENAQTAIDLMETRVDLDNTGMELKNSSGVKIAKYGTTSTFWDGVAHADTNRKLQLNASGITLWGGAAAGNDYLNLAAGSLSMYSNNVRNLNITDHGINIGPAATGPASAGAHNAIVGNLSLHSGGASIFGDTTNTYTTVTSAGLTVVNDGTNVANFGSTMRIGENSGSKSALRVAANGTLTIGTSGTSNISLTAAGAVTVAGTINASGGTFTNIDVNSGTIGGFTIGTNTLTATNFTLDPSGKSISLGTGNTIFIADADVGIQLGHATFGSAPFRVTTAGALTASSATITGTLTAGSTIVSTPIADVVTGSAAGTTTSAYFSDGVLPRSRGGFGESTTGSTGVPYLNGGWNFEDELAVARGGTGDSVSTTWLNANVHSYAVQGGTNVTWKRFASGKVEPSSATYTFTIVWKDGAGNGVGLSPYTTVMRADFDSTNNDIDSFTTVSNNASATVGTIQGAGTTSAYIDVTSGNTTCRLTATYVSLTSFNFKFSS